MRIVSFNANGLRASARKGFFDWFADNDVDVLCVQETKAQTPQLMVPEYLPDGYHAHFR
ncbi:MAG: exodeoxyribonuclease III, partial [Xanthomonadales bacterium]|nr:exodeoxyribonuclease III [Xanthomonadales bacterium]